MQAYASVIESDVESFRIAALVDVGGRERAQIEQFESQIRDRDILMRELQHRVKNNLQLITALIRLEARSAAEGETVALARLASRIDALTVLYRTLSAENAPPEIDLGQYLSDIATSVMEVNAIESVQIEIEAGYCPLSINIAMPAGLLINEMLTNALKYAFVGRNSWPVEADLQAGERSGDDRRVRRRCRTGRTPGMAVAAEAWRADPADAEGKCQECRVPRRKHPRAGHLVHPDVRCGAGDDAELSRLVRRLIRNGSGKS